MAIPCMFFSNIRRRCESYDKAILLKPEFADAYYNRANSLYALQQYPAALESYDKAILLNPRHAEAHNNRGSALTCPAAARGGTRELRQGHPAQAGLCGSP